MQDEKSEVSREQVAAQKIREAKNLVAGTLPHIPIHNVGAGNAIENSGTIAATLSQIDEYARRVRAKHEKD
jgi:hypothetical protein